MRPVAVTGYMSPKPNVVCVTVEKYIASMKLNCFPTLKVAFGNKVYITENTNKIVKFVKINCHLLIIIYLFKKKKLCDI